MHRSAHDRLFQKRQRILTKQQLNGLSPQERQFAEEQFRLIYAQQMSRVTADMSHKKKVLENLNTRQQEDQQTMKDQFEKLKYKMASIEENRSKKLDEKMKSYKQNDQRWFNKLKEIQSKFKQKNREAIQKAKKYRQQSQNYWKNKEKKIHEVSKTNFQHSRTAKYESDSLHRSFMVEKNKDHQKYKGLGAAKRLTLENHHTQRDNNSLSRAEIDAQIRLHKEKSQNLHKQKQKQTFQKAMQKMAMIEQKRAKINKQKQPKLIQPTKPKIVDLSHPSLNQKQKKQKEKRKRTYQDAGVSMNHKTHSKGSLEKLIKDHLQIKHRLQESQFMQRGQVLQNSIQKTRKDRILKMIKNKVQQIKVVTMMKQASRSTLLAP